MSTCIGKISIRRFVIIKLVYKALCTITILEKLKISNLTLYSKKFNLIKEFSKPYGRMSCQRSQTLFLCKLTQMVFIVYSLVFWFAYGIVNWVSQASVLTFAEVSVPPRKSQQRGSTPGCPGQGCLPGLPVPCQCGMCAAASCFVLCKDPAGSSLPDNRVLCAWEPWSQPRAFCRSYTLSASVSWFREWPVVM